MTDIDDTKFEKARADAEIFYGGVKSVWCPYFKEEVTFNSKGWEHLRFTGVRHARSRGDQYIRLRLISLAPEIIKASHTLQGISVRKSFEREKSHSRWESILRNVTYYE